MKQTKTHFLVACAIIVAMATQGLMPFVSAAPAAPVYEERSLIATAYYSPLPNQSFYLRGSYEGDIRLNGNGTNWASGKEVFVGMIAAPKSYQFGTKIWIEGLGVGSVEDRWGAIVPAGERGYAHDRIDIWMGSGEEGLRRALKWGKRTVKARVYTTPSAEVKVAFSLPGGKIDSTGTPYVSKSVASAVEKDELEAKIALFAKEEQKVRKRFEALNMPTVGQVSKDVRLLQEVLIELGYFDRKSTGIFGEYTINAIAKFQMDHKLVSGKTDPNAGKFGKVTREKLVYETLFAGIDIEEKLR